jgi:DNA-binding MarR family transcriptional regulator
VEIAEISRLLFGRPLRLVLLVWILERPDTAFFQSEPARALGCSTSNVVEELGRFLELGLVSEVPRTDGERRQYYLRDDGNPLWTIVRAAALAVSATI